MIIKRQWNSIFHHFLSSLFAFYTFWVHTKRHYLHSPFCLASYLENKLWGVRVVCGCVGVGMWVCGWKGQPNVWCQALAQPCSTPSRTYHHLYKGGRGAQEFSLSSTADSHTQVPRYPFSFSWVSWTTLFGLDKCLRLTVALITQWLACHETKWI